MRHFIWVFTVCYSTYLGVSGPERVNVLRTISPPLHLSGNLIYGNDYKICIAWSLWNGCAFVTAASCRGLKGFLNSCVNIYEMLSRRFFYTTKVTIETQLDDKWGLGCICKAQDKTPFFKLKNLDFFLICP